MFIDNITQPRPHGSVSRADSEMAVTSSDRISRVARHDRCEEKKFSCHTRESLFCRKFQGKEGVNLPENADSDILTVTLFPYCSPHT